MTARHLSCAIGLASLLAVTPAVAQQVLNAQTSTTSKAELQPTVADYTTQFRDKGWNRELIELFFAIKVDRAAYDRVQTKYRHTDQRMILAARDTRDLRLNGRQNFEDISTLTRDEVNQLRKHALQGGKAGAKK